MFRTEVSIKERFENAKKEIRKQLGVKVRVNVYECCRSCVTNEKLGIKTDNDAVIWHYGGQGHAFGWDTDGTPVSREVLYRGYTRWNESGITNILFNHNGLTDAQKRDIVYVFEKWGIVVDWDMSDSKCIGIDFVTTYEQDQAFRKQEEDAKNAVAVEADVAVMC